MTLAPSIGENVWSAQLFTGFCFVWIRWRGVPADFDFGVKMASTGVRRSGSSVGSSSGSFDSIRVATRVRPLIAKEVSAGLSEQWAYEDRRVGDDCLDLTIGGQLFSFSSLSDLAQERLRPVIRLRYGVSARSGQRRRLLQARVTPNRWRPQRLQRDGLRLRTELVRY